MIIMPTYDPSNYINQRKIIEETQHVEGTLIADLFGRQTPKYNTQGAI
jgi:hypothetical protein